jgi:hypothetical protein
MRRLCRASAIIAVLAVSGFIRAARGDEVLVSNLDQSPGGLSPSQIDTTDSWAQEFTSGISSPLAFIKASLGELDPGTNGDFTLTAQLFSVTTAGNTPDQGTLVGTLAQNGPIPTGSGNFANVEFDPTTTTNLDKNLFYWLVLSGQSGDGSGAAQWQFTDSTTVHGPGTLPDFAFSNDGGMSWTPGPGGGVSPFLVEVDGSAVPEPSSLILWCMSFPAAMIARRWAMKRRLAA